MTAGARDWLRENWFVAAVPPLLLIEWLVASQAGAELGSMVEVVVLFDLCLFMPALYLICYWSSVPRKQLFLKALGLMCLGVYLATYMVPEAAQQVLPQLYWARMGGLAVLALIELRLLLTVLKMVWGSGAGAAQVRAASGAPEWVARLLVLEARFWRTVWRVIRRR